MITKPAILECAQCGKIFIGWKSDRRPKGGPTCLKCQTRQAWQALTGASEPKGRGAGKKRRPERKPAKRSVARKKVASRGAARATSQRAARAKA